MKVCDRVIHIKKLHRKTGKPITGYIHHLSRKRYNGEQYPIVHWDHNSSPDNYPVHPTLLSIVPSALGIGTT